MSPRRRNVNPEIARVLERLKIAIQALGYSLRDIERRLRVSDGYLSRVFMGTIELKMEHVTGIAKALGMTPEELMAFVYPKPTQPMSPPAYDLWRRVGGAPIYGLPGDQKPPPAERPLTQKDLEEALRKAVSEVLASLTGRLTETPK